MQSVKLQTWLIETEVGVMICLSQGGLRSQNSSSRFAFFSSVFPEFSNISLYHCFQESHVVLKYCDLMLSFEKTLNARAQEEAKDESFPVTIGINAFRGFMDEFVNKKKSGELPAIKKEKKDKKKKDKDKEYFVSQLVEIVFRTSER